MENHVIMMIGLPGSGKSTYAKLASLPDDVYLSSDELRYELFGHYELNRNGELFQEMNKRAKNALKEGKNVIYDATNLNRKKRRHFVKHVAKGYPVHAKLVHADPVACASRNKHDVDFKTIVSMLRRFHTPLLHEGFETIETITEEVEFSIRRKFEFLTQYHDLENYEQDSPYHTLTLGRHIYKTYENVFQATRDKDTKLKDEEVTALEYAALLHDIGKPLARYQDGNKVRYTGHENISSYLTIPFIKPETYVGGMVHTLISYHMRMHDNNMRVPKLIAEVGIDMAELLQILNKADKEAH